MKLIEKTFNFIENAASGLFGLVKAILWVAFFIAIIVLMVGIIF